MWGNFTKRWNEGLNYQMFLFFPNPVFISYWFLIKQNITPLFFRCRKDNTYEKLHDAWKMLKQTTDYFKLVDWRRLKLKQYLIVFYTKKGRKSKKTNETLTRLKSNCCVFRPTFRCCAQPKAGAFQKCYLVLHLVYLFDKKRTKPIGKSAFSQLL